MSNLLLAHRQKAEFLEHELWVAQRTDGNWQLWIQGKNSLQHEKVFADQDEAKRVVHYLAHWHFEKKSLCDCTAGLRWESARPPEDISKE